MPKKNSLKIVPIAKRYGRNNPDDRTEPADKLIGFRLMEYTMGAPGEQKHYGNNRVWDPRNNVWVDRGLDTTIEWIDNVPFEATLTLRHLERGRSAARFWFEDEKTRTLYPFFGQTLVDMLSQTTMDHGRVKATWIVVKKGANYGIELYS